MRLRGKRIKYETIDGDFTMIPNELLRTKMNHVDKLVLIGMYRHKVGFKLAYTRLTKELAIPKSTLIESWKRLNEEGRIIQTDDDYIINFKGTGNDHKSNGTASVTEGKQGTGDDLSEVQKMDMSGSVSGHSLVRETTQNGTPNVPNEQDNTKEEKEKNKKKEEESVVGGCGMGSDSATTPDGVAPSSPPQPQLGEEKKTVSKYTSNENERLSLLSGYADYLQRNPDSKLSFTNYEDILMLVVYVYESEKNKWDISKWQEVISLITPNGNVQVYNEYINNFGKGLKENKYNLQEVIDELRQKLIASNNENYQSI